MKIKIFYQKHKQKLDDFEAQVNDFYGRSPSD
ncbi:hypothetical protein J2T50_001896 [Streptococcus gallinaceus]|nr:hypothetical protein [Streptococcus gallinaceus]MCP1770955.1 hypothetical protein [Streptococcus gallinaceus]